VRITNNFNPQYASSNKKTAINQSKTGNNFGVILQKAKANITQRTSFTATLNTYTASDAVRPPRGITTINIEDHPKALTSEEAKELRAEDPSLVIVPYMHNSYITGDLISDYTGYWTVAEPGDAYYGLSSDELSAAIMRKYNGGWNHNQDWADMMGDLVMNGFMTEEQCNALDMVRNSMINKTYGHEIDRLGTNIDYDLFLANFRFSYLDFLDELKNVSNQVQSVTEHKDFLKSFGEKIVAVFRVYTMK